MNITRHVWLAKDKNVRRLAKYLRVRGTSHVRIARVRELVCEVLTEAAHGQAGRGRVGPG